MWSKSWKINFLSLVVPSLMPYHHFHVNDKRKWIKRACKKHKSIKNLYFNQVSVTDFFSFIFYIQNKEREKNYSTIEYDLLDWRVDYCIKYPFRISFFILFIGFQFHIYHIDIFLWSVRLRFYCYLLGLQRNAFVWFHPFSHSPAHNKNIAFNNFMDKTFTLGHIHVCKWHSEGISFAINSTSFDYITSYPQMWIISSISCFFTP